MSSEKRVTGEAMNAAYTAWRLCNYGELSGRAAVEQIALAIDAHTAKLREQLRLAVEARKAWADAKMGTRKPTDDLPEECDQRLRAAGVVCEGEQKGPRT